MKRPYVLEMIKEAVDNLNGEVSYKDIKKYIDRKWKDVNPQTLTDQLQVLSVNHKSRINYPQNQKPRLTNFNSRYDFLFNTDRGKTIKYDPEIHGVWEIYKNEEHKFSIRMFSEPAAEKIYTPNNIIWFKSVTNSNNGEAYLDFSEKIFILNFPLKHRMNIVSPKIGDIILIYQKVNGIASFTHLVTPVEVGEFDENIRSNFRYGRRVKIIAKTGKENAIPVSSTLWNKQRLSGVVNGNACEIENMKNIKDTVDVLRFDIWQKFIPYFVSDEQQSVSTTLAIINELQSTNPELSVIEGELRLVSHLVKERNRKIVLEKKQDAILNNTLLCEVCTFSFPEVFNASFIECHHLNPIGEAGVRETQKEDLALVCSNCHRMLHTKFDGQFLSIKQLQKRMKIISKSPK